MVGGVFVVIVVLAFAAVAAAGGSASGGGMSSGFASSGNDAAARASDSTEAAGIRAHLASASRAELARLERLEHKWRLPHDSTTHVRATNALLDSAEALVNGSPSLASEATAVLSQIVQPVTSMQSRRQERLRSRAETRTRESAQAAALAAEKAADAQKWSYSTSTDPMSGGTSHMARISSENTVSFDFPYQGAQHADLVIRNHPSFGRDVIIQIERGQILCPSYDDCTVRVRFDDGSAERWTAAGPADHSTTSVFLRASTRFVQRMRNAKVVRIAIPIYQEGEPAFEFRVGGFDNQRYTTGS